MQEAETFGRDAPDHRAHDQAESVCDVLRAVRSEAATDCQGYKRFMQDLQYEIPMENDRNFKGFYYENKQE